MIRPTRIAEGVEAFAARTPTLPPATHTQSYAIGERQVVLVEPATPYEEERRQWLEWARGLESTGRQLIGLFVTHHHPDHVGGAAFFARELRLPLMGHALTSERMDVALDRFLDESDALVLEGPTPQRWEILHTPGHAVGHLCLLERDLGHVVVGDMVASVGTILVAPGEGDMAEYIRQLERLGDLDARLALPAHGAPIDEPREHFAFYVRHRLMREGKVLAAVRAARADGASVETLLPVAYDDTPRAAYPLATLSLQAHLEKLMRDGAVRGDGERYYYLGPNP